MDKETILTLSENAFENIQTDGICYCSYSGKDKFVNGKCVYCGGKNVIRRDI